MKKIIAYFIKYPVSVNTLLAIITIFGAIAYSNLTASFFPLIDSRIVTVQLIYPGASPEEMEEGVVALIEEKLEGVSGIERITSSSNENAAAIIIEVEKKYNTSTALEDIQNAVNSINSFPNGLEKPVVFLKENVNFTINYAVAGKSISLKALKEYGQRIEKDLMQHEGISKVELAGFPDEEIEIALNDVALRKYGITIEQAGLLIRSANIDITGGSVKTSKEELLIRSRNKGYEARQLENLVLKTTPGGAVVRLKDVATVQDKWADDPNRIYINGNPGIEVLVSSTDQEDLLENAEYVRNYFKKFSELNPQLSATLIKDQSDTLQERKDLLLKNGLIGMLLVLLLLTLFLNIRIAFWVAIGLPISFLGMFVLALYFGVTINVISLFGMIVVIGILVDDGIVISENIFSHYEQGKSAIRAAIDGTMEVLPAVFSAVVTTMIAFSFFFLVDGRAGDFFSELAFVVIATLFVSLIEALIILPSHLAYSKALKSGKKKSKLELTTDKIMYVLRDKLYAPTLRFALNHKIFAFLFAVAFMIITIGGIKGELIKFTFFPVIERNDVPVNLSMPAGTRESVTNERLLLIEDAIWEVNDKLKEESGSDIDVISNIERKLGPNTHEGSINAILVGSEKRTVSSMELASLFRQKVGLMDDVDKLTYGNASAFGKPVSITFQGEDQAELDAAKTELKIKMMELPQLKDVVESVQEGRREINLKLKDKAYILGLNEAQIMNQIRQGYFGYEAQRLQRGKDEVKVWVRFDDEQRSSIYDLEDTRIRTLDGKEIPLRELADFSIKRGVVAINHLDGQKQVTIEAEVSNNQVSAPVVIAQIRDEIIPEILAKHQSISPLYEGQNREAAKTQESAKFALPFILFCIIAVITFTFRSFAQSVIILLLLVPFSLIGVAWGHYFHGQQMSILSFLGVVALIGIIVNDSLVLVGKMNGFLKDGMKFKEAVYNAGYVRFRAIFLTSLTTIAGLAPLILEKSFQAQFLIPMAISVAYGIGIATVLTLILLPVFLSAWNDIKRGGFWLWNGGIMPSAEEVEPSIKEMESEKYED
ncbi:MAG: efflux RND transporter permease subunit [Bacteroidia bacterium]|nr:efflux RND transporter permease subunit [Bacteroidia bacterium]NNJ55975.1 efflux RND transporter permease subunit [Bacteroidia bacterium]